MAPFVAPARAAPGRHARRRHRHAARASIAGLVGLAAFHVQAQSEPPVVTPEPPAAAAPKRQFAIVPELTVMQTFSDNAALSTTDKRADSITQITPSIRVRSNAGRVQGFLDYALSGLIYGRGTYSSTFQQYLNAAVRAEAVENFAFVDANAGITRQNISALGTPSPDAGLRTSNQTEVATYSVAPYVRGRFGGSVAYQARLNYSATHSNADAFGNSSSRGGTVHLGSDRSFPLLNWALDGSRQTTDYDRGRQTDLDSGVASLLYTPFSDLEFALRGGREINNILSAEREGSTTYGGGLRWAPSPRTLVSLYGDKRFFGHSYAVTLEQRTRQMAFTLSASRDVSTDVAAAARGRGAQISEFELLFLQLASRYPDPLERARQALIELQRLGKSPFAIAPGGFLSNAVRLQRSEAASIAYLGLRTTVIASAQQIDSQRLDPLSSAVDSLSGGTSIRQRSIALAAAHRLTPLQSLNASVSQSRSLDLQLGTRIDLLTCLVGWTHQLAERTRVGVGARHSVSSGDSSRYTENAVFATLSLQF